jgi:L-malate glycosyltransferase
VKVLQLSSEKYFRGGERQIAYLISELQKLGVTNIVAGRRHSEFTKYCRKYRIKLYELPFRNSFDIGSAVAIKKICRQEKIDLIHAHSAKSHAIAVTSALIGNTTPLILSRRVAFLPKNNWLTRFKYNHSAVKRIICVSHKINEIMRSYVSSPDKCVTVHSGVDLEKFKDSGDRIDLRHEFNIAASTLLIGNTAALEKEKDYFTFIRTIKELISTGTEVTGLIIGAGSMRKELKEFVYSLNIDPYIVFTGFRSDVQQILSSLDVFLFTSEDEGLGTSVLDAFAAEVPVVSTDAGGLPEMVMHMKSGLLAPVKNYKALAKNIQLLQLDNNLRATLIKGALEHLKEFTKEKTAIRTLAVYEEVLSQK